MATTKQLRKDLLRKVTRSLDQRPLDRAGGELFRVGIDYLLGGSGSWGPNLMMVNPIVTLPVAAKPISFSFYLKEVPLYPCFTKGVVFDKDEGASLPGYCRAISDELLNPVLGWNTVSFGTEYILAAQEIFYGIYIGNNTVKMSTQNLAAGDQYYTTDYAYPNVSVGTYFSNPVVHTNDGQFYIEFESV